MVTSKATFIATGPFSQMNESMALDTPWKAGSGRLLEIIRLLCFKQFKHVAAGQQDAFQVHLWPSLQPNFLPGSEIGLSGSKQGQAKWLKSFQ